MYDRQSLTMTAHLVLLTAATMFVTAQQAGRAPATFGSFGWAEGAALPAAVCASDFATAQPYLRRLTATLLVADADAVLIDDAAQCP